MKGLVHFFFVGFLGLVFTNTIDNPILKKSLESTGKLTNEDTKSSASLHFLTIETKGSQSEKENTLPSPSVTAPLFALSTTEITKKQGNTTESRQNNKDYIKDQEQLLHSDSQESPFKENQLFPSAPGKSIKRSYSTNSTNAIQSAGSGYYDKTIDSHHEYGYPDADHHGIGEGEHEGHHEHEHDYHHKSTPLKPSIVHRDPHAAFDKHDKIRTLDKDLLFDAKHKTDHGYHQKQPYHYDGQKIPDCVQKNIYFYNLTFCLEDHFYPRDEVMWAIKQSGDHVYHLLSDVTYQSADNLIDGLTRAEEEGLVHHKTHQNKKKKRSGYHDSNDHKNEGYICQSDIYYGRPRRAMNSYGKWKVIVNLDNVPLHIHPQHTYLGDHSSGNNHHQYHHEILPDGTEHTEYHVDHHFKKIHQKKLYTQTLRLEQCTDFNGPCSYIDSHYHSRCIQKHNFVRLVAWTYELGLHVDTFKMPIACSCHVKEPIHYHHDHESHSHKAKSHHLILPNHETAHGSKDGHASEAVSISVTKKLESKN